MREAFGDPHRSLYLCLCHDLVRVWHLVVALVCHHECYCLVNFLSDCSECLCVCLAVRDMRRPVGRRIRLLLKGVVGRSFGMMRDEEAIEQSQFFDNKTGSKHRIHLSDFGFENEDDTLHDADSEMDQPKRDSPVVLAYSAL